MSHCEDWVILDDLEMDKLMNAKTKKDLMRALVVVRRERDWYRDRQREMSKRLRRLVEKARTMNGEIR